VRDTGTGMDEDTLFMSGHSAETLPAEVSIPLNAFFLPKPFTPQALASKIKQVLAG